MIKPKNKPKNLINITNVIGDAEILLYGFVGQYDDIDWEPFQAAFREMAIYNKNITLRINCMGGDTFKGLSIYDLVRNSECTVTGINEGVCASMGAILLQACDVRKSTPNSRVMLHGVSGRAQGTTKEVESYLNLMKDEDKKLFAILKTRTKADDATVTEWMCKDSWFDANAAKAAGLIDEIATSSKDACPACGGAGCAECQDDDLENSTADEIWTRFKNVYQPQNTIMNKIKLLIIAMFGSTGITNSLTENDADEKFVDQIKNALTAKDLKITNQATEITGLKAELEAAKKVVTDAAEAEITALLAAAEADGRVNAANKPALLTVLKADLEAGKTIVASLQPKADVNVILAANKVTAAATTTEDRKAWTYDDWATKDSKGLEALENSNKEAFDALVQAKVKAVKESGIMS